MKYTLKIAEIDDQKWDSFIEDSICGSLFQKSFFLKASGASYQSYYCYKNEELRAAVLCNTNEISSSSGFIIYNGIIYGKPTNKQNQAQTVSEQFEIQDFIAHELIKKSKTISMSLSPEIMDIRPFLWVHYGENKPKYQVDIRYTSYLNISDFINEIGYENFLAYKNASSARRQQIRYAKKKNYITKVENDISAFLKFYELTMNRQNIHISQEYLQNMFNLISKLLELNLVKIFVTYDDKNEASSMAIFGWDQKRAYYLYGANDPSKRNGHGGTIVLWDAFVYLRNKGILEVDLEGVNSPKRGWFKLSYGGNLIPYYQILYKT